MPADALEIDEAQEEGVEFKFLTNPDKILTRNGKVCGIKLQIMELGEPDASGRRKPVAIEGKFETLEVDSVIMAIGQKPELSGFEALDATNRGTISADESTFRTNIEGVFAIGDATNKGADIAIAAIGEARKSASVVDSYLRGNIIGYKKPILVEREITADDLADREHIAREKCMCSRLTKESATLTRWRSALRTNRLAARHHAALNAAALTITGAS